MNDKSIKNGQVQMDEKKKEQEKIRELLNFPDRKKNLVK